MSCRYIQNKLKKKAKGCAKQSKNEAKNARNEARTRAEKRPHDSAPKSGTAGRPVIWHVQAVPGGTTVPSGTACPCHMARPCHVCCFAGFGFLNPFLLVFERGFAWGFLPRLLHTKSKALWEQFRLELELD